MKCHVQGFTQEPEEMRDELQTSIGDVRWNSVFGEHMEDKELGELSGDDSIVSWNEDWLFGESIKIAV